MYNNNCYNLEWTTTRLNNCMYHICKGNGAGIITDLDLSARKRRGEAHMERIVDFDGDADDLIGLLPTLDYEKTGVRILPRTNKDNGELDVYVSLMDLVNKAAAPVLGADDSDKL